MKTSTCLNHTGNPAFNDKNTVNPFCIPMQKGFLMKDLCEREDLGLSCNCYQFVLKVIYEKNHTGIFSIYISI